jgi:hypothetical protein
MWYIQLFSGRAVKNEQTLEQLIGERRELEFISFSLLTPRSL